MQTLGWGNADIGLGQCILGRSNADIDIVWGIEISWSNPLLILLLGYSKFEPVHFKWCAPDPSKLMAEITCREVSEKKSFPLPVENSL